MSSPLDAADLRVRVQRCIDDELTHQRAVLADLGPDVTDLVDVIGDLLSGGKRLRAAFLYWGHRAAGQPDSDALVRLATAMEFFQAAALLHDDVMDDSDTRRGLPAAHRALAQRHAERGWEGRGDRFGLAGAILAGNLCLGWTDELVATCGLPTEMIARGRGWFDLMRTQLMAGQYLDVVESVRPWGGLGHAERLARTERVVHFKSAKYSIEHPLLIGAAAGGLADAVLRDLANYGLTLGHAFQLRDDLLGVYGDPEVTGKPAGDDIREGKRTVLIAHAVELASPAEVTELEAALGDPALDAAAVTRVRGILDGSGAVAAVEAEIAALTAEARAALARADGLEPTARDILDALVEVATARHF